MIDPRVEEVTQNLGLLLSLFPEEPRQFGATFRAKCPIHGGERLSVGIRQGNDGWVFRCFACDAHGDAIHLVRLLDGVGFKQALEVLAAGRPSIAMWSAPKPKAFVLACDGRGCGARLELEAIDLVLVDIAHPSWTVDGDQAWCPRCSRAS